MPERMNMRPMPGVAEGHGDVCGEGEGFVDDDVVRGVLAMRGFERVRVTAEDMALSSSEDDFAGWALPVSSPFRKYGEELDRVVAEQRQEEVKRPWAKVEDEEEGLEEPYRGGHRWWLLGVTGMLTCLIFSLMILSFVWRGGSDAGLTEGMEGAVSGGVVSEEAGEGWEMTRLDQDGAR